MLRQEKQILPIISNALELAARSVGEICDVPNTTAIIAEFADTSGLYEALYAGFAEKLRDNLFGTNEEESGRFSFVWNGLNLLVYGIQINYEQDMYVHGLFCEYDSVYCHVQVCGQDGAAVEGGTRCTFVGNDDGDSGFRDIAEQVIPLVLDKCVCQFCNQLIVGMKMFDVCKHCALTQQAINCVSCGKKRGRFVAGEREHSVCKRLRVSAEAFGR